MNDDDSREDNEQLDGEGRPEKASDKLVGGLPISVGLLQRHDHTRFQSEHETNMSFLCFMRH